jgi:hypothetical protein
MNGSRCVVRALLGHVHGTASRLSPIVRIRRARLYRIVVWVVSGAQGLRHSRAILIG